MGKEHFFRRRNPKLPSLKDGAFELFMEGLRANAFPEGTEKDLAYLLISTEQAAALEACLKEDKNKGVIVTVTVKGGGVKTYTSDGVLPSIEPNLRAFRKKRVPTGTFYGTLDGAEDQSDDEENSNSWGKNA